jgi:transposase
VYVRDDRPSGSNEAPAVWFAYTPDRRGEHPQRHLANFTGVLQADAFAGGSVAIRMTGQEKAI